MATPDKLHQETVLGSKSGVRKSSKEGKDFHPWCKHLLAHCCTATPLFVAVPN